MINIVRIFMNWSQDESDSVGTEVLFDEVHNLIVQNGFAGLFDILLVFFVAVKV